MNIQSAIVEWQQALGEECVLTAGSAQSAYGPCTTPSRRRIPAAVRPASSDQISAIIEIARRYKIPIYPISTGHNWGYGTGNPAVDDCVIVDLSRLNQIIDVDEELGLVTLQPGVTYGQLQRYLVDHNLPFLVPVTGAGPTCSLMGCALERGYGITPYSDHFAAVMALEAVLANGRRYTSALSELGGHTADRAYKWGLGPYIDGLFAQGNFGIVTQMTIALAPRPEKIEAFFFSVEDDTKLEDAVATVRKIIRRTTGITGSINLMNNRRVLSMSVPYPSDEVPRGEVMPESLVAQLARENRVTAWTGMGALYGEPQTVRTTRAFIKKQLRGCTKRVLFTDMNRLKYMERLSKLVAGSNSRISRMTQRLRSTMEIMEGYPSEIALPLSYWKSGHRPNELAALNPARDHCGLIWYAPLVPMKPGHVRRFVRLVTDICTTHGIEPLITLTTLSDRCFDSTIPLLFDHDDNDEVARAQQCYNALYNAGQSEGFVPYRLGIDTMQLVTEHTSIFWDTAGKLKRALDPDNIMAPGRYIPSN